MSKFKRLLFLGTSSGVPLPGKRNVSGMLIQYDCGRAILVDCGEATQHQLMMSDVRLNRLSCILITHLHGDHCYGLFGLLHSLNMSGRAERISLFGPTGIKELIQTVFRLTGGWYGFDIDIHEISGGVQSFNVSLGIDSVITVTACPMVHRLPCYGYVLSEQQSLPKIDAARARKLGAEGAQLGILKSGVSVNVRLDCGTYRVIEPSDVCVPATPARCIGIMQDTSDASEAYAFLKNCAILVHEATYEAAHHAKAIQFGHSTTAMAAEAARISGAARLVLTHFSAKYNDSDLERLRSEAAETSGCPVDYAKDFSQFTL